MYVEEPKIELKAVIEFDAPTFMNLKRFMQKQFETMSDYEKEALGKFMGVLNCYDLDGY